MSGLSFRGTTLSQDPRFNSRKKKQKLAEIRAFGAVAQRQRDAMLMALCVDLCAGRKAPPEFDVKVNMKKVKRDVVEQWLTQRVTELLGFDDDVVIGLVVNSLDEPVRVFVCLCVCVSVSLGLCLYPVFSFLSSSGVVHVAVAVSMSVCV